jgi:hypothetical protein
VGSHFFHALYSIQPQSAPSLSAFIASRKRVIFLCCFLIGFKLPLLLMDREIFEEYNTCFTVHGLINYIDTKAKWSHLKKLTCKETLRQVFICLRPSPLLGFCLGWSKPLNNMVSNKTQHPPPSHSHTLSVYTVLWAGKGGGRVEPERRLEGQQFTKLGRKDQLLYLQSINSYKHLPQSPFKSQFFKTTTFCFGVYIVN